MKTKLTFFIAICMSIAVYAQDTTIVPPGDIYGTWTFQGSPYLITGTTTVPTDSTLIIEAGVTVEWQGSYTMYVLGQILALGTESDSVVFTAADPDVGFRGIRFESPQTASRAQVSEFEYCIFEYGKVYGDNPDNCGGAIAAFDFSDIIIDHCLFRNNEALDNSIGQYRPSTSSASPASRIGCTLSSNTCAFTWLPVRLGRSPLPAGSQ